MDRKHMLAHLKRHTPLVIGLGIAMVVATVSLVIEGDFFEFGPLSKKGLIHLLDLKSLDLKYANRRVDSLPEPKVVVAAIDEKSVARYGLWPWSRAVVAQFIRAATAGGAKVIAFDAFFSDEDRNASWMTLKRFAQAYADAELHPDSVLAIRLAEALQAATAQHTEAGRALQGLEQRLAREHGPARSQLAATVRVARAEYGRTTRAMEQAHATIAELTSRASKFYDLMRSEVDATSPDEALAAAIAASPQTVLGFVAFYHPQEIVGVSDAVARDGVRRLDAVAIDDVYENVRQEVGGQIVDIYQPKAEVDVAKLQIRSMIGVLPPLEILAQAARGFGYINVSPDPDGPMRRIWLVHKHGNKLYPSLSLLTAARYFGADIRPLDGSIKAGLTIDGFASLDAASGRAVPTNPHGHFLINYYTDPRAYFPTYSVADILDGTVPPSAYQDKVLLFGMTAQGLFDLRATPFNPATPGVYIHASAIQNMIDGSYLDRPFGLVLLEALFYLLLGALLGLLLPRVPAWAGVLVTLAVMASFYVIDVYLVFPQGTWVLNVLPSLQALLTYLGIAVYGFFTEGREKRMIRKAFQYYLTKSVVDEVLRDPSKLKLGGEKRECTILFSDVRGFTSISEKLSPEALVALLNSYLTPMTDIVYKYDGTLDKYIGDAVMAVFGAPVAYGDHAARACRVCLEMMGTLRALQGGWREQGLPELDIGIGLNTGLVSAGNMGSSQRFDYTVMGDNVNLASRLEGINKQYGTNIIISEFTYEAAKNAVYAREIDRVRVKGKREPVKIYELLGQGPPPQEHADLVGEFERALALYRGQRWDEAISAFDLVRTKIKPDDPAAALYIERCHTMREHPPGAEWDGVYVMTSK